MFVDHENGKGNGFEDFSPLGDLSVLFVDTVLEFFDALSPAEGEVIKFFNKACVFGVVRYGFF